MEGVYVDMPGVIKTVLTNELRNLRRTKKEYETLLKKLPQGCLAVKNIGGHEYFYLVRRIEGKVKYLYQGKMTAKQVEKYQNAKKLRVMYRKRLSETKKQIKFLESSLRGKIEV